MTAIAPPALQVDLSWSPARLRIVSAGVFAGCRELIATTERPFTREALVALFAVFALSAMVALFAVFAWSAVTALGTGPSEDSSTSFPFVLLSFSSEVPTAFFLICREPTLLAEIAQALPPKTPNTAIVAITLA